MGCFRQTRCICIGRPVTRSKTTIGWLDLAGLLNAPISRFVLRQLTFYEAGFALTGAPMDRLPASVLLASQREGGDMEFFSYP